MILIIDNYDSFTHNLYQYLREITPEPVKVYRNDALTIHLIEQLAPSAIVLGPGPGRPEEAGITEEVILRFMGRIPILGVCLGHQAIGHALGGRIIQAREIVHGKAQDIEVDGKGIYRGMASPTRFTRYHSLAIDEETLPAELEVTARAADGEIMGVRHRDHILEGVQFHPESIASEEGKKLLRNFLNYRRDRFDAAAMLTRIMEGNDLSVAEASSFMEELTDGNLSDIQIGAFLAAFTTKGVTASEIAGCAQVLLRKRTAIDLGDTPLLDTCGTGGDGLHTFNISSLAALVASAAGAKVAKHGNRGVSSVSGSADFYQALGIEINLSPAEATTLLLEEGFSFLFAPHYHSAMRFAAPARKALKVKTLMNLMGPLVNPAGAQYQLIGVYHPALCGPMAEAARLLGARRVLVVHGGDGSDEISVSHPTQGIFIDEDGVVEDMDIRPESFGIGPYLAGDLRGGTAAMNAALTKALLGHEDATISDEVEARHLAAIRDAVILNAGAALFVYGTAYNLQDGVDQAREAWDNGAVLAKLEAVTAGARRLFGTIPAGSET